MVMLVLGEALRFIKNWLLLSLALEVDIDIVEEGNEVSVEQLILDGFLLIEIVIENQGELFLGEDVDSHFYFHNLNECIVIRQSVVGNVVVFEGIQEDFFSC